MRENLFTLEEERTHGPPDSPGAPTQVIDRLGRPRGLIHVTRRFLERVEPLICLVAMHLFIRGIPKNEQWSFLVRREYRTVPPALCPEG